MLNMTWNMGGSEKITFLNIRDQILENISQYDLVTFCVQECARKQKMRRADEI